MLKKRYFQVIFLFIVSFMFVPNDVLGVTFKDGPACYQYNHSTGAYGGSGCSDKVKTSANGKYAFCSEFANHFSGTTCSVDSSWDQKKKYAIVTGYIVYTVFHDDAYKDYDKTKKYGVASIAINTYLANTYPTSWGKYSRGSGRLANDGNYLQNKTIKGIIDTAKETYAARKTNVTKLPAVSFVANSTLKTSGGSYLSDKITVKGLVKNFGGGDADTGTGDVTYTITAKVSGGKVFICNRADGKGVCPETREISNHSGDVAFYLAVVPENGQDLSNKIVTVTIKGANTTAYRTSVRYNCGVGNQHLIVTDSKFEKVERSIKASAQLKVPAKPPEDPAYVQHHISAIKVDDNGDLLEGATLSLYQGDPDHGGEKVAENANGAPEVSKSFNRVEVGKKDPAFEHDYYLVETVAPAGYKLNRIKHVFTKNSITGLEPSNTTCYYVGDSESLEATVEKDLNFCEPGNFEYLCQTEDKSETRPLADGGGCDFSVDEGSGGTSSGDGTGETSEPSGDTPTEPVTPAKVWKQICWNKNARSEANGAYCANQDKYVKVVTTNGNIVVTHTNEKNKVIISKRAATGNDEVAGAKLKICTADSYKAKKNDCDVAKTIDDVDLSWTSGSQPREWQGLKAGEYYIIETLPPSGYVVATQATKFTMSAEGEVTTGGTVLKDGDPVIVKNSLTSVSVSKQDMATSKELPGATISICSTYKDEKGNYQVYEETDPSDEKKSHDCIPAVLADGTAATWESGDKPHQIVGLPAGTYYLVERIAPKGYSTAESILFTMKEDGSVVDKDGNSIKDSKLVMKDSKLKEVKTGQFTTYVVIGLTIFMIGLGAGTYYLMNYKKVDVIQKIRKRKIHKTGL